MSVSEWLLIVVACIGGAVSPGPSLALVLQHASTSLRGGLLCSWAHACGVGIYASLAVTGVAVLLGQSESLKITLSLAAGFWLLRLAVLSALHWKAPVPPIQRQRDALRDGLTMGLVNPKVAVFFLAVFTAALPENVPALGQSLAVLTAIAVDGGWYSILSVGVQHPRLNTILRRNLPGLSLLSAAILCVLGLGLLWQVVTAMNP
ncbi:MAG: LysE family translocator [Oceanococcus sp.]